VTADATLAAQFLATIRNRQLFSPGDTLIIAISGGADSTALLDLLANLPDTPLQLIAAHLNHCLRGAESDGDEQFCRSLAQRYALPFESRRVDVKALAQEYSCGLEDAGRRARVAFFDELAVRWKARAVVLAHHADDQAETFLMRLLRGSGTSGLSCMSHHNDRGYLRPLLAVTRKEIEMYLTERGLAWREDSSNQVQFFLRNRIRHELLPLLEQYNPAIRSTLATTAQLISDEDELLEELAATKATTICQPTARGIVCSRSGLFELPRALQRRVIRRILSDTCGNLEHFGSSHIESVCRLAAAERSNARLNLPQGVSVIREYHDLLFSRQLPPEKAEFSVQLASPGQYRLPSGDVLSIAESQVPACFGNDPNTVFIDLAKAPFPWHVRLPLPGDRLKPFGMEGSKKLKELFIDSKIPLAQRRSTPLVFSGSELIWVCGLRFSGSAQLDAATTHIVKVVFSRHP